jgi:hypothetical protein
MDRRPQSRNNSVGERLALTPALSPRRGKIVWMRSKESPINGRQMIGKIVSSPGGLGERADFILTALAAEFDSTHR